MELTNEQRVCFGLEPIDPSWDRVEIPEVSGMRNTIHPERLLGFSDLEVSDVKYKDNIPFFSVKGKSRLRKINMNANELVWANGKNGVFKMEKEDFAGFRKIIEGEGAELVEENFNPWKIRFVMKNAGLEETENLIARLAAFVLERGIAIRRLVIRKGGFDDFELEIETSSELEPWMGVNLSILEQSQLILI